VVRVSPDFATPTFVSVDPGKRQCGVAWWTVQGGLIEAKIVESMVGPIPDEPRARPWRATFDAMAEYLRKSRPLYLVLEVPQIYGAASKWSGDPNDLVDVAAVAGALSITCDRLPATYLPHAWKVSVKKEVMTARIRERWCTEVDRAAVKLPSSKDLAHNVWDAVGLGLHHLRKLGLRPPK